MELGEWASAPAFCVEAERSGVWSTNRKVWRAARFVFFGGCASGCVAKRWFWGKFGASGYGRGVSVGELSVIGEKGLLLRTCWYAGGMFSAGELPCVGVGESSMEVKSAHETLLVVPCDNFFFLESPVLSIFDDLGQGHFAFVVSEFENASGEDHFLGRT